MVEYPLLLCSLSPSMFCFELSHIQRITGIDKNDTILKIKILHIVIIAVSTHSIALLDWRIMNCSQGRDQKRQDYAWVDSEQVVMKLKISHKCHDDSVPRFYSISMRRSLPYRPIG